MTSEAASGHLQVEWLSRGRQLQGDPDPDYPDGVDIDLATEGTVRHGAAGACFTPLPYPAPECGIWRVSCPVCGYAIGVTAGGRPDDPRSIRVPCKPIRSA